MSHRIKRLLRYAFLARYRCCLLADSVGLALLVVLETLAPAERLASVLTTCSTSPSTRSLLSSIALPPPRGNSPAAHAAASRERPRQPTPISPASEKLSTHSPPHHAPATSTALLTPLDPDVVLRYIIANGKSSKSKLSPTPIASAISSLPYSATDKPTGDSSRECSFS
jgi:hypothetical protein